jgi:heterodisulfide reductase subunit A
MWKRQGNMASPEEYPVVVLGGGIAGITAALELNRAGVKVALVEKSPFFGGQAANFSCKATEVCQKCGACRVELALRDLFAAPGFSLYPQTELVESRRVNGLFHLTLKSQPQIIHRHRCIDCGICLDECPAAAQGAILTTAAAANHPRFAVNPAACRYFRDGSCRICQDVCFTQAIDLERAETTVHLEAAALVLATGYQPAQTNLRPVYAQGGRPQIITGLDLEKLLRQGGLLVRPGDGRPVRRLGFIQCVGSRDQDRPYCSRVCCGYGLRLARLIRHRRPECEVTTFYMDLQNVGQDPDNFQEACGREINLIRSLPGDATAMADGSLRLRYLDEASGRARFQEVDLLVLAVGIAPGPDNPTLAAMLHLELTEEGFLKPREALTATDAPGIFLAGTAAGPKSILECIAEAAQSARLVGKYLEERT